VGSNLAKNEFNFLFAKFSFGMNMKREEEILAARQPSGLGRQPIIVFQ